jgi:ankyrin repeat protein
MYAAHHDHTAAVLVLLQFVASVDIQNQEGRTALMLAAAEGYTAAVVQALLQMNPDVSLTDNVSIILRFAAPVRAVVVTPESLLLRCYHRTARQR